MNDRPNPKLILYLSATQRLVPYAFDRLRPYSRGTGSAAIRSAQSSFRNVLKASSTVLRNASEPKHSISAILLHLDALRTTIESGWSEAEKEERDRLYSALMQYYRGNVEDIVAQIMINPGLHALVSRLVSFEGQALPEAYCACLKLVEAIWRSVAVDDRIVHEIRFAPGRQQAGIAILNYFSVVLAQISPELESEVVISQHKSLVIMTIIYPDGRRDEVSRAFSDYNRVIAGDLEPEQLMPQPIHALALRNKVEMALLEARHARDLLETERRFSDQRYTSVAEENNYLRRQLALQLDRDSAERERVHQLLVAANERASQIMSTVEVEQLAESIWAKKESDALSLLKTVQQREEGGFERFSRFLFVSATSGSIGNTTFEWLRIFWPIIPR